MYSFDHDLEEFVAIGLGTVSKDGTVIRSNEGVGVIKAGWHCGSQPDGGGCGHSVGECQECTGACVIEDKPPETPLKEQTPNDCRRATCGGFEEEDDLDEDVRKCKFCILGTLTNKPDGKKTPVPPKAVVPSVLLVDNELSALGRTSPNLSHKEGISFSCKPKCVSGVEKWQLSGPGLEVNIVMKRRDVYKHRDVKVTLPSGKTEMLECKPVSLSVSQPDIVQLVTDHERHHASEFAKMADRVNEAFVGNNEYNSNSGCLVDLNNLGRRIDSELQDIHKNQRCHHDPIFSNQSIGHGAGQVLWQLSYEEDGTLVCNTYVDIDTTAYPDDAGGENQCPDVSQQ